MGKFPGIETNLGDYVDQFVSFLDTTFKSFFDAIFIITSNMINAIDDFLVWLPWWLFIILIIILGWYFKYIFSGFLYVLFIFLICTFSFYVYIMTNFSFILVIMLVSEADYLIIRINIGIYYTYRKCVSTIIRPILDAMQTMPSFVYLIPAIFFFGLGNVSAIFATLIYALPPVIRLTELAIRGVD